MDNLLLMKSLGLMVKPSEMFDYIETLFFVFLNVYLIAGKIYFLFVIYLKKDDIRFKKLI